MHNFIFYFGNNQNLSSKQLLDGLLAVFGITVQDQNVNDYFNIFEPKAGEERSIYNDRLIQSSLELYKDENLILTATHELNDEQEKVVNYICCFLNLNKKDGESFKLHWANSNMDLRPSTEQYYQLRASELSPERVFEIRDRILDTFKWSDQTLHIEENIKWLLDTYRSQNNRLAASDLKQNFKILNSFKSGDTHWMLSEINDYDGVFWNLHKILLADSDRDDLHFGVWNRYSIEKLIETSKNDLPAEIIHKIRN